METTRQYLEQNTEVVDRWEWPVAVGVFLTILGIVALVAPVASSVALAWLIGALFLASGIAQFVHAIRAFHLRGSVSRFLLAGLSIVAGAVIMRNPVAGTAGVTLALCFYLLISSVAKFLLCLDVRPAKGWGILMANSVVSLLLGIFLIAVFPVASLVVPGVFFGVDLIVYGCAIAGFAFVAHRARPVGRGGIIGVPEEQRPQKAA